MSENDVENIPCFIDGVINLRYIDIGMFYGNYMKIQEFIRGV